MRIENEERDRWVLRGYLALLCWLPVPLGSNRYWAHAILLLWIAFLLIVLLLCQRKQWRGLVVRTAQFQAPLLCFALFLLYSIFQSMALPDAWVRWLSPEAYAVQAQAHMQGEMHLSIDVYESRVALGLSVAYALLFWLGTMVIDTQERAGKLMRTLVWSGTAQALLGIFLFSTEAQYNLFFVSVTHDNVIGTFVNRNHMAGYLEMCLAIGVGLMLGSVRSETSFWQSGWRKRVVTALHFAISPSMRLRLMLVIMVIALVLTRSRMGNSAFFTALLATSALAMLRAHIFKPSVLVLVLSLVLVDGVVIGNWVGIDQVMTRLKNTELTIAHQGMEESVEQRSLPARYSVQLIRQFPLFGSGAGSFYNAFARVRAPEITYYFDHAHNDYAEFIADLGIGAIMLALLPLMAFWRAVKMLREKPLGIPYGMAFASAMGIVSLAMHSLVDFNLHIPANAATFIAVLTLGFCCSLPPFRRH